MKCWPWSRPREIVMVRALASMLFSTSSAIAFNGLLCDSAIMVMAFQSSPIFNRPRVLAGSPLSSCGIKLVKETASSFRTNCNLG
jgi:hypothetical protein